PHGDIVRIWRNDAARSSTSHSIDVWPSSNGSKSLSAAAIDESAFKPSLRSFKPSLNPKEVIPEFFFAKPLTFKTTPTIPNDFAIVIFQIKGVSIKNGNGFLFALIDSESGNVLPGSKTRPNIIGVAALFGQKEAVWIAHAVPAGRLKLVSLIRSHDSDYLSLCLGAPAFETHAGDIIYGGSFDLSAEQFSPDLALEPVKQWLLDKPFDSEKIVPAAYTNGWTSSCSGAAIYAIEFAGAPFKDGYTWGSAASSVKSQSINK
ncbi:MAG: hypothetical protein ABUL58_07665, partial [Steroidobacter sp.]